MAVKSTKKLFLEYTEQLGVVLDMIADGSLYKYAADQAGDITKDVRRTLMQARDDLAHIASKPDPPSVDEILNRAFYGN